MWYNVENLYDTAGDPKTTNDDFTPTGHYHWTKKRYNEKVTKLTQVIHNIVKPDFPDIIGLAEVENDTVLMSLVNKMRENGMPDYSFVHYNSPDQRGIDVAMIYNKKSFTVQESTPISVHLPGIKERTRDILYVKGAMKNEEILHLFFIHFPSRNEGTEETEPRRCFATNILKENIDKILCENEQSNIAILGDFNDTPNNKSIAEVLNAQKLFNNPQPDKLYNLLYPKIDKGLGTIYYYGWLLFDQIIVSGDLLNNPKIECTAAHADIFNPHYLLYFGQNGTVQPNRTYHRRYIGGYSDHLPVFLKMKLK
jgi:endonuclease/exonuclease/phosphatase family metal-dependent hydrolase